MNKQELRSLIKEEITRILSEAKAETFTLSEPKSTSKGKPIYIVDTFQDYDVATIKATPAGSEIKERFANWKYIYNGSPEQLVKELIKIKAVHTASGKYIESDTERDSIRKGIKALGSKLKKVKA